MFFSTVLSMPVLALLHPDAERARAELRDRDAVLGSKVHRLEARAREAEHAKEDAVMQL